MGSTVGIPGVPDGILVMVGDNSNIEVIAGKQVLVGVHVAVEVASGVIGNTVGEHVEPMAAIINDEITTAIFLARPFLYLMASPSSIIPLQTRIPYILVVIYRTGAEEPVYLITFQLCIFIF